MKRTTFSLVSAIFLALRLPLSAQTFPSFPDMNDFSDVMMETPDTAMVFDPSDVPLVQAEPIYPGTPATVEPYLPETAPVNYEGPIGVTGVIDNVTTGCSYSPLSHSNLRAIDDIVVPGSVGKYPLKMTRYYNGRSWYWDYYRGLSPGWSHQYSWLLWSFGQKVISPQGNVYDFYCGPPVGVSEGWDDGVQATHPNGGIWRLADGGRVHFSGGMADYIEDPYGLRTTIAHDAYNRVSRVTEPGGRYLQFTYGTTNAYTDPAWGNKLLQTVEAWDGQGHLIESVTYTYTSVDSGGRDPITNQPIIRKMLTGVAYDDNTSASYTYRADNVPESRPRTFKFAPLLEACNDKRYSGAMRQIFYEYDDGGPHGAIRKERKDNASGQLVSRIEPDVPLLTTGGWMPTQFTETRGDGPARTFTYTPFRVNLQNPDPNEYDPCLDVNANIPPQQMLTDFTDFTGLQGHTTHIGYDPNTWYITSVRDANGYTTNYERGNTPSQDGTGEIKKITHPGGSYIQYGYQPETGALDGHYITSIRDENDHTTTISRDSTRHWITRIDYPSDANTPPSHEEFSDFDSLGHPHTHRLANGAYESFTYGGRGLLTNKYNPKFGAIPGGNDPHTHYDYYTAADGKPGWIDRVKTVTGPAPTYEWSQQASETYEYDRKSDGTPCAGRGLVTKITHADNRYQSFKYDQWGNKLKEWNELGERTDYVYDNYNRVTTVTRVMSPASNEVTSYRYRPTNGNGTSPYLHTTNNPDTITAPTGIVTSNVYDENFRKTSSTAAFGTSQAATTWFHYDAVGNLQCVTDPRGSGECPSPYTQCGYTTRTDYDSRNRKLHVWDAQNHRTTFTYDGASNVRYIERPDLKIEEKRYDALNRIRTDIMPYKGGNSPVNLITRFEYNPSGTIHKVTLSNDDANDLSPNHWTTFDYDESDRRTTMTYQNNQTQSWAYDNAGNMKSRRAVGGETQYFAYDNRNRKWGKAWENAQAEWVILALDSASRVRRAVNGGWDQNLNPTITSDIHRDYDHAGRLTMDKQDIDGEGSGLGAKEVHYKYELSLGGGDGKPTEIYINPAPNPSYDYDFRYDEMGRFEKILPHGSNNAQFQYYYDPASNETRRQNHLTGVDQYYNPDSLNRPTTADLFRNGSRFARESYDYNNMGRLRSVTRLDNRQDQFGYYLDGELYWVMYGVSGVSAPDPNENPPAEDPDKEKTPEDFLSLSGWDPNLALTADHTVTYVYDKAGNRTWVADSRPNQSRTYTPNLINQYTAVQDSVISNGPEHEINSYQGPNENQSVTYTYLRDEHLIRATSAATYDLAYDAFGRCVKRTVDGVVKYYIYDGEKPILEYGILGNPRGKNLYGKGIDEILMRWDGTVQDPAFRTFYYQQNYEGSVTHLTKPDGTIFERYRYDVFGTPTIYDGDWHGLGASAVSNRFMFTGREYAAAFGFYEYRARAYHPGLGRFMSEDPKLFVRRTGLGKGPDDWSFEKHPGEAEFNLFRYCENDPVNNSDPMGLDPIGVLPQVDMMAQEGLSRDYNSMIANSGFLGLHPYEYSTTVFRDSLGNLSLSQTETLKQIDRSRPPERSDMKSEVETHSHGLDIPHNKTTGALPSEPDIRRGNDTGRAQYVISRDGKTRQRFRPDEDAGRRAKNEGGTIEEFKDGKWTPVRGANTDLNHPGAGKNWPYSR